MKRLLDMTEPELTSYFNAVAGATESIMPAGPSKNGRALFALIVFDDPGLAQYVSNASRDDVIKALRECADRIERNQTLARVEFN